MNPIDYCKGIETKLIAWKAKMYDLTRKTAIRADLGVMRPFSRKEEYEADSHGVVILKRANYDGKQVMGNTLTWLMKTAGPSGGFFENHPAPTIASNEFMICHRPSTHQLGET